MRTDRLRIQDALEQIDLIRQFASPGRDAMETDLLRESAILHRLALLGEACRALSPTLRESHPEVPWPQVIAFRNILIHEYFGVDMDLVWGIITGGLDELRLALESILQQLSPSE